MNVVAGVLMIAGAAFALIAAIGVLRFGDTYSRMHAASKGPTLALLLVVIGAAIELADARAVLLLVLALGLQLLTTPVGSHMLGRSVHRDAPVEGVDELARDLEHPDTPDP